MDFREQMRIELMMDKYWTSFPKGYFRDATNREIYQVYLQSPRWQEIREMVSERSNGICEQCRKRPMKEVHHDKYPEEWGLEEESDVRGLCTRCHHEIHNAGRRWRLSS
jgi:hypothetical protein